MDKLEIYKPGESIPFKFTLDDEKASIEGWTCTISLKQLPLDAAILSRVVTPADQTWKGFLTSSETASLTPGLYFLHGEKVQADTDEKQIDEYRFRITEGWT